MSALVLCQGCGQELLVPNEHGRPHIRCPVCGALCDVGGPAPSWAISAAPLPPAPAPAHQVAEEEDDRPYAIPPHPDDKSPCVKCKKLVAQGAVVCAFCGYNRETGEKLERVYKPVQKEWETGLPFAIRIGIFSATVVMATLASIVVALVDGAPIPLLISLLFGIVLQAYALGTYSRINLTRSRKGRVRLTRTWRLGFIPLGAAEINWREYEGVSARQSGETDFWDWAIFLLLLGCGLIPALIWWIFMMQPGQFDAALCRGHGYPALILYRGPSQAMAQDLAATIRDFTGLP